MNSFCKTFFTLFFTAVITAMLLLSYGLVCSLHDLADTGTHSIKVGTIARMYDTVNSTNIM